jgi:DNA-binding IclR family transcriptional regulator
MARLSNGESVVSRVVRLFDSFDPETPAVSLGELARRADLPLATTSRLVSELTGTGWLRRDGRRIGIGTRLWELGMYARPVPDLRDEALPYMEDIHEIIGHHVQLSVRHNQEVLCIQRLSTPAHCTTHTAHTRAADTTTSGVLHRLPLHATAPGLVLLAFAPPDAQEAILAGRPRQANHRIVTESARLRSLLDDIRDRGFAYCPGLLTDDTACIAAPIRDRTATVIAALSATVPNTPTARSAILAVVAAARGISRAIAHHPHPQSPDRQ